MSRRTWDGDVDQVLKVSLAYMKGILPADAFVQDASDLDPQLESGIAPDAKHLSGAGIDERDQHLSHASNSRARPTPTCSPRRHQDLRHH